MAEEQSAIEVVTQTEYIYEDTQCVSGVEPEYKWDEVYRLISRREVPDMGLEEEPIYANIEKSAIRNQAEKFELNIEFLEPTSFEGLAAEAVAWKKFLENQAGPSS